MKYLPVVAKLSLLGLALLLGCSRTTSWSGRIISKTEKPLASFLNPHVSEVNVLIVDGKRFEHVRGLARFYIPMPDRNSILFVVDEKNYSITYHILNMDTREDISISAATSVFGESIGSPNVRDKVDRIEDGKVILSRLDQGAKSTLASLTNLYAVEHIYYLDLSNRMVSADKTIYRDKAGKVLEIYDGLTGEIKAKE